jgi:2',3'-cyclic-nucleotide 2'-phosphodiesterase (5'-nucleotidase family)
MADALLQAAQLQDRHVEAAILNYGGIRLPYIASGVITVGKIYELMPFDNQLTVIEIPGDTLIRFCDYMALAKGWPVSGISFAIKDRKAINILVNGQPVQANKVYKIATNDYLANGGDYCSFLTQLKRSTTSLLIRDVCIDYVKDLAKQGKHLHPYIDKRVYNAE